MPSPPPITPLKAGFSSYGAFVDVAAPGVNIYSTDLGGGYRPASGTSMACPHVAGTSALLRSVNSDLTPNQIEGLLKTTAEDRGALGWDTHFGAGRINAYQAVGEAISGDLNFPEATVSAPASGATVSGLSVPIIGTASGDRFSAYQVELAPAGTSNWSVVHSSTSPVSNGVLGTWDTTAMADGNYLIRLVVTDLSGRSLTSAVAVTLDRFDSAIHSPTQLVGQGSVDVMGSAATTSGVPFGSFTLEWGAGTAPSSYSTAGITGNDHGHSCTVSAAFNSSNAKIGRPGPNNLLLRLQPRRHLELWTGQHKRYGPVFNPGSAVNPEFETNHCISDTGDFEYHEIAALVAGYSGCRRTPWGRC